MLPYLTIPGDVQVNKGELGNIKKHKTLKDKMMFSYCFSCNNN